LNQLGIKTIRNNQWKSTNISYLLNWKTEIIFHKPQAGIAGNENLKFIFRANWNLEILFTPIIFSKFYQEFYQVNSCKK
jgi:Golgi nucleoside diphosphatase